MTTVSASVTVSADTIPTLYADQNGAHISVKSEDRGGSLILYAGTVGALGAFLDAARAAIDAHKDAQAPVLPLEDVLSTHPAEVAG